MINRDTFYPGVYYHVFNRTNNKERLFKNDRDKYFFIRRLKEYIHPFCHIYCYCLLYNHFHVLIRPRTEAEILDYLYSLSSKKLKVRQRNWLELNETEREFHTILEIQFTRYFISYAKAFNKTWNRNGNLFNRPFKRKAVEDSSHLTYLVYYIQANSSKHGGDPDFTKYRWSSYPLHLSHKATFLEREEILSWFGGKDGYVDYHHQPSPWLGGDELLIED